MNGKQGLEDYRGRWKRISDTVKKLGAFSHVSRRRQSSNSLEGIEAKFYSDDTKRRLSKQSSQSLLQHAPYYSRPSEQADSLGDLSRLRKGRNMHLPPLTSDEARDIEKQALQKRIRRKRSVIFTNSNPHLNVLACGSHSVSPRTLTDEVRTGDTTSDTFQFFRTVDLLISTIVHNSYNIVSHLITFCNLFMPLLLAVIRSYIIF